MSKSTGNLPRKPKAPKKLDDSSSKPANHAGDKKLPKKNKKTTPKPKNQQKLENNKFQQFTQNLMAQVKNTRPYTGATLRGSVQQDSIRFKLIWLIMAVLLSTLLARAFYIQVINKDFYQQISDKVISTVSTQPSYRGMITDRNNMPLAISAPLITLVFSPYDYAVAYYDLKKRQLSLERSAPTKSNKRSLEKIHQQLSEMDLRHLAKLANVPLADLQQAVNLKTDVNVFDKEAIKNVLPSGKGSHYFKLLDNVQPEEAQAIIDANFVGVNIETQYRRYYPQAQPNAQIVGFMGKSDNDKDNSYRGRAGIEKMFDKQLSGKDGKILVLKDAKNNRLKEIRQVSPEVPGEDIQLTIDSRLQYILYTELEKVGKEQEAQWATGIIADVSTGEILAMSNWPSFNPNDLNTMTADNQRNHAMIDIFEPGSVMKPITVGIALKSGQYSVLSQIDTTPGSLKVPGYTIKDHGNLGVIDFRRLLQKSSNVGSAKIALTFPPKAFSDGQKAFGFGKKTDIGFPSEAAGNVPTPKNHEVAHRATVAYGYGLEVTLAQLAQSYVVLGSGGIFNPLTLVKKSTNNPSVPVVSADGETVNTIINLPEKPKTQVLKPSDAKAIVDMMVSVTEPGGTATLAAIDGYKVAGKTGTARRVNPKGGYFKDQYRTSFVGIAPASNPRFVVAIMVEDPRKQKYGGLVSAPVFRNVMKETLRLYNVPYDKYLTGQETKNATPMEVNDL